MAGLCQAKAGAKGLGEFLREGVVLEEGTHVMQYGGRESYKDPRKDYTFKILKGKGRKKDLFLDASEEKYQLLSSSV